jgi:hypothetical protein
MWDIGLQQYDMQYFIQLKGVPESLRPINFPGLPAHLKIKRTRKHQIERAKFMDHTGYEWSQWWPKRHGPRQLQVITTPSTRLLENQRGENNEPTTEISGV